MLTLCLVAAVSCLFCLLGIGLRCDIALAPRLALQLGAKETLLPASNPVTEAMGAAAVDYSNSVVPSKI